MKLTVNDDEIQVGEQTTVAELIDRLALPDKGIAVAVNWAVLPRSEWDQPIPPDACVVVVTAVQGG